MSLGGDTFPISTDIVYTPSKYYMSHILTGGFRESWSSLIFMSLVAYF